MCCGVSRSHQPAAAVAALALPVIWRQRDREYYVKREQLKSTHASLFPPDPEAFVVAVAHCTREQIKETPVGTGLFFCKSVTAGDRGLKEHTVDGDSTGSSFAAHGLLE